ncbi:MAG TPA: integrin alpha, partial [Phycisphaerae bacterium]|nr:integrin alpha [Phycisphaerae bacterium]
VSEIGAAVGPLRGIAFQGYNFNDFAGSNVAPIADVDGDGYGDLAIVAQFGKPGWDNWGTDGAGVGEAYVIFGGAGLVGFEGQSVKLNATGSILPGAVPGLVLAGLRSVSSNPPNSGDRGGISGIRAIPDQDDDLAPELAVSFPAVNSRKYGSLNRKGQFLRGGVVVLSSQSNEFSPTYRDSSGNRAIELTQVGQNFSDESVTPMLPGQNRWGCKSLDPTAGAPSNCDDPTTTTCDFPGQTPTGCPESGMDHGIGFTDALVDESAFGWWKNGLWSYLNGSGGRLCRCPEPAAPPLYGPDDIQMAPGSWPFIGIPDVTDKFTPDGDFVGKYMNSGFYVGSSLPPYGMRIIGLNDGDRFGQSIGFVDDMIIFGSPQSNGEGLVFAMQMRNITPTVKRLYGVPRARINPGGGQAYAPYDREPGPRPYQYVILEGGSSGGNTMRDTSLSSTLVLYNGSGRANETVGQTVQGTVDFDGDTYGDILVGAPNAFNAASGGDDSGAVYLIYRRMMALEGHRDLQTLELAANVPQRLYGVFIRGYPG